MSELENAKAPLKILIVEDEKTVRGLLSDIFSFEGYSVVQAQEGNEALRLLEEDDFDVVLTDLGLPGVSGWQVAKKVKEKDSQKVVIIISGWGATLERDKLGIDYALPKPFDIAEVQKLFREIARKIEAKKPSSPND